MEMGREQKKEKVKKPFLFIFSLYEIVENIIFPEARERAGAAAGERDTETPCLEMKQTDGRMDGRTGETKVR